MTRRTVYAAALVGFLAACAMTLTSIILPKWISWDSSTPGGIFTHSTLGLHRRCSSLTGRCEQYPEYEDCRGEDRSFCSLWRSVGFLMSFAVVMEGVTLITFLVILAGGKQRRENGWRVMCGLLGFVGVVQCAGMGIVAWLYNNDDRFDDTIFPGWKLDISWILCTASWCVMILLACGISLAPLLLEPEGGYELIPSEEDRERED